MYKKKNKQIVFKRITNIFGIGVEKATKFFDRIGINKRNNASFIKKKKIKGLNRLIKKNLTEKKLKKNIQEIKIFSQKIKTYKSIRNKLNYPCRGQRTHTNAKTKRKI